MQSDPLRSGAIFRLKPATPQSAGKPENAPRTLLPRSAGSARAAPAESGVIQRQFDQLYRATPLPMALRRSLGQPQTLGQTQSPGLYSGAAVQFAMQQESLALEQQAYPVHDPQPQYQHVQPQYQHVQPQYQHVQPQYQHVQPQYQHVQPQYQHVPPPMHSPPQVPPAPAVHNLQPPRSVQQEEPPRSVQQEEPPKPASPETDTATDKSPPPKPRRLHSKIDSLQLLFASPNAGKAAGAGGSGGKKDKEQKQQPKSRPRSVEPAAAATAAGSSTPASASGRSPATATTSTTTASSKASSKSAQKKAASTKKRSRSAVRDIESTKPFGSSENASRKRKSAGAPASAPDPGPPRAPAATTATTTARSSSAIRTKEQSRTAKAWSEEEIQALHLAHSSLPVNDRNFWSQVAKKVPGRTAAECQAQWFASVAPTKKKAGAKRIAPEHISSLAAVDATTEDKPDGGTGGGGTVKPTRKARAAVVAARQEMFLEEQDDLFSQTPMKVRKRNFDEHKVADIPTPAQRRPSTASSDLESESLGGGDGGDDDDDSEEFELEDEGDEEEEIDLSWKEKYASRMRRGKKLPTKKRHTVPTKKTLAPMPVRPGQKIPTKKRKNTAKEVVSSHDGSEYQVHVVVSPGGTTHTSVRDDENNDVDVIGTDSDSEDSEFL